MARAFRPVLRTAVKGGIRTGRWLSQVAEQTREHFEDVVAEARHEMGEEGEPHSHHHHGHDHDHGHVHRTPPSPKTES
jgi:ABC-type Zn2+ transport system substrate-binding protein/surface adhesin